MKSETLVKTVFFDAPPADVWAFLIDKDKLGEWYHPAEADLAEGADYRLMKVAEDGTRSPLITGRVLKMQAHEKLVTTFVIGPFNGAETTLTWSLQAVAGGTRLTLEHDGIAEAAGDAALPLLMALDAGWDEHFAKLRGAASA